MSRLGLMGWRIRPRVVVTGLLLAIAAAMALIGVSILPLLLVVAIPWVFVCRQRFGAAISISAAVLASSWLLLAVQMATALVGAPMVSTLVILWLAMGLSGALALGDARVCLPWSAATFARWLPALLGPLVWFGTEVVSLTIRGAAHYSWVMAGDSANNVLFARQIISRGGVAVGSGENPVPLPAALLALSMASGRPAVSPARLLQHDIGAFVVIWTLLIAATCYFAGVAACSLVSDKQPWIVAVVGAGVSVIPLTWFVSGYPIEFGFFNMHIAIPILFLCCIAVGAARRSPVAVLVLLLLASTSVLAVWSPLVLIPAALGLYVGFTNMKSVLLTRGWRLGVLVGALLQLIGYLAVVVLPGLFAQGSALSAAGAVFPFAKRFMFIVFFVSGLSFLLAQVIGPRRPGWTLFSAFAGGATSLAILLFISRNAHPSPWTYYPSKLAWVMMVVGLVLLLGMLAAVVARNVRRWIPAAIALIAVACVAAVTVVIAPQSVRTYLPANALAHVTSVTSSEATTERIFELSNPERPSILWNSGEADEGAVNFWLLQMRAGLTQKNLPLRVLAYYNDPTKVKDLCEIVRLMRGTVVVKTREVDLGNQLAEECPSDALSVDIQLVP